MRRRIFYSYSHLYCYYYYYLVCIYILLNLTVRATMLYMERSEYSQLKQIAEAKYKKAQTEYRNDMQALKRVWQLSNNIVADKPTEPTAVQESLYTVPNEDASSQPTFNLDSPLGLRTKGLRSAIKTVLSNLPNLFTRNDILIALKEDYPELYRTMNQNSVRNTLYALLKDNEIRVETEAQGTKPAVYSKIIPTPEDV